MGWAVLEKSRGDETTYSVIVGAWVAENSGYLQTLADWEDEQAKQKVSERWSLKQYRRVAGVP